MTEAELNELKFPIGKFQKPAELTDLLRASFIKDIETFPARLRKEVSSLSDQQVNTPYRPEGWTIRQVVHHCADSHMNSLIRFKLALTEDKPVIKPYFEDRWAELSDSKNLSIEHSLLLLEGLHARWTVLLRNISKEDLKKSFVHPEHGREISLEENLGTYAWHCNHHLAHITYLKKRMNWA